MITINLNQPILTGDGEPMENGPTLARFLSDQMLSSNPQPMLKYWDWAMSLRKTGIIEMDQTDREMLLRWLEANVNLTLLGKHQLYEAVRQAKE